MTERVTRVDRVRTIGMCSGYVSGIPPIPAKGRRQMRVGIGMAERPFPQAVTWWGRSFLLTNEGEGIQREALPENWLIVRVNPLSLQAIHRARQEVVPESYAGGRELPY